MGVQLFLQGDVRSVGRALGSPPKKWDWHQAGGGPSDWQPLSCHFTSEMLGHSLALSAPSTCQFRNMSKHLLCVGPPTLPPPLLLI